MVSISKQIVLYVALLFFSISAVQAQQESLSLTNQPKIVVSIEPLYEIVSSLSHGIVKPHVVYLNLSDIHKPLTAYQHGMLQNADIIIRVGKGLEPLLDDFLQQQGQSIKNKTITLSNYIPLLEKEGLRSGLPENAIFTDRQTSSDLRFWMDPRLVKMLVSFIAPRLVTMDPLHQEEYLDNEIVLKAQLKKVEDKMLTLFNQLSFEQKFLIARFNPYLKNRYMNFADINHVAAHNHIQPGVVSCIQNHSFSTIPLNLEYTERALNSLLQTLELCSKSRIVIR